MHRGPGDLEHFKTRPERMSLGVGVINVKTTVIETPEAIADRLVEAAQHVPAERIAVSTDCGLLNLKREHANLKIQALVEGTRIARERLSGS
jgi:5-methyltetrahydropteroyltriglutamate--homocysteine methyltransferase